MMHQLRLSKHRTEPMVLAAVLAFSWILFAVTDSLLGVFRAGRSTRMKGPVRALFGTLRLVRSKALGALFVANVVILVAALQKRLAKSRPDRC